MNKVALITGASRGMGKAVAIDLAKQGYQVVLAARTEEKLHEVQESIIKGGGRAVYFLIDVSDVNAIKRCVKEVIQKFGRTDVLFNNAGILTFGTTDISVEDIDEMIKVNLLGAIYFAKFVGEQMKKQNSGYIINLASMGGKRSMPFNGVYCASKFGLVGYGEAQFKELMPYGIKVTSICPAITATDMTKRFGFDPALMIQPQDIVKTINYLLGLGKTAAVQEILVQCATFVARETEDSLSRYKAD